MTRKLLIGLFLYLFMPLSEGYASSGEKLNTFETGLPESYLQRISYAQIAPDGSEQIVSVVKLIHESRERLAAGDLDSALKYARDAVAIDPAYADAWKQLGRVLMLQGNYAEAIPSFQTVLMFRPDDRDVGVWILRSYLSQDQTKEITKLIEKLRDVITPELDNKLITDLLARLFEQSDMQGAAKVAEFWKKRAPQTGARQVATGISQIVEGKLESAQHTLLTTDTSNKEVFLLLSLAWHRLGIQYLENNEPAKAVEAFQKSLEFRPGWIQSIRELGWAYRRAGKHEQAANTWSHGLKTDARLTGWLLWIAQTHTDAGQFKDAQTAVDRLLRSDPRNSEACALKLSLLVLQKKDKEAQHYTKQLSKVRRGDYLIALGYVFADRYTGQFSKAANRLEKFLHKYPKDKEMRKILAETYAEWAYRVPSKEAIHPLQKLVELEPSRTSAWRDLGWSLWANGKYDEAINTWEHAFTGDVTNRDRIVIQVVAWLAEEGQSEKAIELYKRWKPDVSLFSLGYEVFETNRFIASRVILSAAWQKGENLPMTGLYLAYSEAHAGICAPVYEHISPFLEQKIHTANPSEIDVLLTTLHTCSTERNLLSAFHKVEESIGRQPEYASRITLLLEKAAGGRKDAHDLETASSLYEKVLKRDPNLVNVWLQAVDIADQLGRREEAVTLLNNVLSGASSESVLEGVRGRLALYEDNLESAVQHYLKSLSINPDQPELRMELFNVLVSFGLYVEARGQTEWFVNQMAKGEEKYRSYLAKIMSDLGETEKALELWQQLYMTYPETPAYAIETARVMFTLCRADEARSILQQLLTINPYPRAYELLAEIELATGYPEQALILSEKGLELEKKQNLLRVRAEAASMLSNPVIAHEAAESILKVDPGNILATIIAGKSLLDQGKIQEAREYYNGLLERNVAFLPGLNHLREISSWMNRTDEALAYSQKIVEQRPWDMFAHLRSAISHAEADKFRPALKFLRTETEKDVKQAVPLLIYSNVTHCSFPGRNNSSQVIEHIERLFAEGFTFITPDELNKASDQPRAIILIDKADTSVLEDINAILKQIGGRILVTVNTGSISSQVPGNPSPAQLKELQSNGHWLIASNGPASYRFVAINDAGTLGNPLTHKIYRKKGIENTDMMSERLDNLLSDASLSLGSVQPRIFVYPRGDYGQLSLDTDLDTIKILNETLEKHFDFSILTDDNGFITHEFHSPYRLIARAVPARWNSDDLMNHIIRKNPFVLSRLELAKVLFLQSQHERANKWFHGAEDLGANPRDVNFHWGNNAYIEGDLPTALEKLRKTQELDTESIKVKESLERAESRKRPSLDLHIEGWRDSDKREYSAWGSDISVHLSDRLFLEIFSEDIEWSRDNKGKEEGVRLGGGIKWYFKEERWLNVRVWNMQLDNFEDHVGGVLSLHFPNASWGGFIEMQAAREEIDTVEAVRKEILADRYALKNYSRVYDFWDLFANITYTHRTDNNDTIMFDGLFQRRLKEWPFYGLGYKFRIADSDENPSEDYWAPVNLLQHELYITTRGEFYRLHYSGSAHAGYAEEENTGWRFVWGGRIELDYRILSKIMLYGRIIHQETPAYDNNIWLLGLRFHF